MLIQGPSSRKTLRINQGEAIEWRLRGEDELWLGTLVEIYPEANAIRINDLLLQLSDIEGVRYRKREGFKTYLRFQGLANLGIIGLAVAFDEGVRVNQRGFVIGAAATNAAMVLAGSVDRQATRRFVPGSRYRLAIVGGDYRVEDDSDSLEKPAPRY